MSAEPVASEGCGEELVSCFSPGFWHSLWVVDILPQFLSLSSQGIIPRCLWPNFLFYKDINHIKLEPF